jgi:hypothetical protein
LFLKSQVKLLTGQVRCGGGTVAEDFKKVDATFYFEKLS